MRFIREFLAKGEGFGLACGLGQGAGKPSTGRFSYSHPFESLSNTEKASGFCHSPFLWRRERDSNPRAVSSKLISSLFNHYDFCGFFVSLSGCFVRPKP